MYQLLEEGHPHELWRAGDYWTKEDVEFFRAHLDLEDSLLARHMKRSEGAITARRKLEDPFVVFDYKAAWLKKLHEREMKAYIREAALEEAALAELEYEITILDCRNAVRWS